MIKKRSTTLGTTINILTSLGVLATNLVVSFFLSPYIIRTIGVEANGFVSLANNFVSYANLIVTALNAMAARFITISYIKKDYKKANEYYNSVFWGNLIIVAVLLLPSVLLVLKMEYVTEIPSQIITDVKILFSFVFLAFFMKTAAPNYDCGPYIANRMDLQNIPAILTSVLRCVILFFMFSMWAPHVWYIGFTSLILSVILLITNGHYTHVLTPQLKVSLKKPICHLKDIKELVGAGIWNSISIAGNTLLTGLDLIICNVFLGSTLMGILSVSKTLPSILVQLLESIRGAFGPELTINYAKGDKDKLVASIKRAMKITSIIATIPVAGVVVMSDAFFSLWVPSQDAKLLQILTILALLSQLINSGVVILFNVFSTVNKVKYNSVAMIISGLLSILLTTLMIVFTDYDIYAVAGISSIVVICKNLFFTLPVAARLLDLKWNAFYPQIGISSLCSFVIIVFGLLVRHLICVDSWLTLFLASAIVGAVGFFVNLLIVLNKQERNYFVSLIRSKLHI